MFDIKGKKNNSGSGTMPLSPDPNSKRSKKRKNRGFTSLEDSSRKHRRAIRRLRQSCNDQGHAYKPGEVYERSLKGGKLSILMHRAGGKMNYH